MTKHRGKPPRPVTTAEEEKILAIMEVVLEEKGVVPDRAILEEWMSSLTSWAQPKNFNGYLRFVHQSIFELLAAHHLSDQTLKPSTYNYVIASVCGLRSVRATFKNKIIQSAESDTIDPDAAMEACYALKENAK